jgi:transcriptional antiterminator Rof (Rho-off)
MSAENLKAHHNKLTLQMKDAIRQAQEASSLISRHLNDPDIYDLNNVESLITALQRHVSDIRAKQNFIFGIELARGELKEE